MTNYAKPTLKNLRDRAISDINSSVKGADANLRRRILNVLATVCAGIGDEILRRTEYLLKQAFLQEADPQYIVKHGQTYKIPRKMASKSEGIALFAATPGSIVPAGTEIKRSDGFIYISTSDTIANSSGECHIKIQAVNAGDNGNTGSGTILSLVNPVAGVEAKGVVSTLGITGGSDIEPMSRYLERLLFYVQNPPTGGSKTDYEIWAREVSGVTRAWCYPTESGPGTVTVRFMMDDNHINGIPNAADVQRVKTYIEKVQPATAVVYVNAPEPDALNITFSSLSPDTTDTRSAIEANLKSLIQASSTKPGSVLALSKIRAAISNAAGVEDFVLSAPNSDIEMETGHIVVLGTITYPEPENG